MVGSIDDVHVPFVSVSDIMAMALEVVVSQYFENHKCAKSSCSSIIIFHKIAINFHTESTSDLVLLNSNAGRISCDFDTMIFLVLDWYRLFFVRSTYFVTNQPKI